MGKVYCSSDWHGCWDPAHKILDFLQSDDTLYFIGDAIDRGPAGIELFDALYNDPRVIFLKGNHEQLMEIALPTFYDETDEYWFTHQNALDNWFINGGEKTYNSIEKRNNLLEYKKYYNLIKTLPTKAEYHSPLGHTVILEHAGYSPFIVNEFRKHDPLWDREHFHDNWYGKNNLLLNPDKTFLIHGHTPVQYLKFEYGYKDGLPLTKKEIEIKYSWWREENKDKFIPKIIRYCGGHKFDIDMCTIISGRIALLDLDTFQEFYFDKDEETYYD